jgi:hypothetical protein
MRTAGDWRRVAEADRFRGVGSRLLNGLHCLRQATVGGSDLPLARLILNYRLHWEGVRQPLACHSFQSSTRPPEAQ